MGQSQASLQQGNGQARPPWWFRHHLAPVPMGEEPQRDRPEQQQVEESAHPDQPGLEQHCDEDPTSDLFADDDPVGLNELREQFECPVCLEMFDDGERTPTTFPCGHSACISHLPKLGQKCPKCRAKIPTRPACRPAIALREAAIALRKVRKAQKEMEEQQRREREERQALQADQPSPVPVVNAIPIATAALPSSYTSPARSTSFNHYCDPVGGFAYFRNEHRQQQPLPDIELLDGDDRYRPTTPALSSSTDSSGSSTSSLASTSDDEESISSNTASSEDDSSDLSDSTTATSVSSSPPRPCRRVVRARARGRGAGPTNAPVARGRGRAARRAV